MKDKKEGYSWDILDKINSVVSARECTGLMQIPPQNIDEAESYNEIYTIPKAVNNIENLKTTEHNVLIEKQKIKS